MMNQIRTYLALDWAKKALLLEAFIALGLARIMIILPFARIAPLLGQSRSVTPETEHAMQRAVAGRVQEAIQIASRHTLWDSKCLVRAIAAMWMMTRRGLESTLYLGTARDDDGKLIAHAWLRSGKRYITGAEEMARFTVVGMFAKRTTVQNQTLTLGAEMQTLLRLMDDKRSPAAEEEGAALCRKIDWAHFTQLVHHHRVGPVLYRQLKEAATESAWEIPDSVLTHMRRTYEHNTFHMLHLSGEMERVSRQLHDHGIRCIFLKGPVIAAKLYGDLSLRTSSDLDLLVPLEDLDQVGDLLESMGYIKDEYIRTVLNDWKWRHHHFVYIHEERHIKVEVHWRLNPAPATGPSFDEMWRRRRISALSHYPVAYPGQEDLFFFLVTHGTRSGWSRLRWIDDIARMMRQGLDMEATLSLLRRHQALPQGGAGLILAGNLLGAPVTSEMLPIMQSRQAKRLAEDTMYYVREMINLHDEPLPEDVSRYHSRYLFRAMHWRQKIRFIASFFYPYPEDAETLPLPPRLHFLYFPLRPLLWAWRKMTNAKPDHG